MWRAWTAAVEMRVMRRVRGGVLAGCWLLGGLLSAAEEVDHHLFTLPGALPGSRFGAAVRVLGDADGDGVADLAVGQPKLTGAAPATGGVVVLSGRTGVELFALDGDVATSWFGQALAAAGDVDGDGHADLAVGAPFANGIGEVRVYSGRDGSLLASIAGAKLGDRFGHALDAAGDVDGDGTVDLLIGSPFSDTTVKDVGRALVISTAGGGVLFDVWGGAFLDQLGFAVSGADDVDGDGAGDVLVGIPLGDAGAFNGGEARLYAGGGAHALLRSFAGTAPADQLGYSVSAAGDVDADAVGDLLVGVPAADANGIDSGLARVFSGADGMALLAIPGEHAGDGLGFTSRAGDIDGDGHDDVLVGAPSAADGGSEAGLVRIVSGRDGSDLLRLTGGAPNEWFGIALDGGTDINGDGVADLLVGSPGHDDQVDLAGLARVFSGVAMALIADRHLMSLGSGGASALRLNAGATFAGANYLLLGTTAGTQPGLALGAALLPLNPTSAYFLYTVQSPNSPPLSGSSGTLDMHGRAVATFLLPPGLPSAAVGITLHHAYVVLQPSAPGGVAFASNAVPLTLTP